MWSDWLAEVSALEVGRGVFVIGERDWERDELVVTVVDELTPSIRATIRFPAARLAGRAWRARFDAVVAWEVRALAQPLLERCRAHEDCRASLALSLACGRRGPS